MTSAERIFAAKRWLRRKYQNDIPGLKALADSVATGGAFDSVTITGDGHEGTSSQGQLTFEPLEYLGAIEDLISELDPAAPQPAALVYHSDFSGRQVQT